MKWFYVFAFAFAALFNFAVACLPPFDGWSLASIVLGGTCVFAAGVEAKKVEND